MVHLVGRGLGLAIEKGPIDAGENDPEVESIEKGAEKETGNVTDIMQMHIHGIDLAVEKETGKGIIVKDLGKTVLLVKECVLV